MVAVLLGSPSSSGLGHRPFKAAARVRIPLGILDQIASDQVKRSPSCRRCRVQHELRAAEERDCAPRPQRCPALGRSAFISWIRPALSAASSVQARADWISFDLGHSRRCPPNSRCSRRSAHAHSAYCDPISRGPGRRSGGRGGLKGSTAIPNRYAQLTKGRFLQPERCRYEPDC
jgi:hypothetical protein